MAKNLGNNKTKKRNHSLMKNIIRRYQTNKQDYSKEIKNLLD